MARILRVEFEGAMYHVTVRGVDRRALFRTDRDRERLLAKLGEGVERFDLDLFLYCWMSNHLHLLVGTPRGNLGRFMGWWLTSYAVYFNLKYNRSGHLTQGRYGAKLVEGDEYLLKLSRYIHLNPVETVALKKATVEERVAALRQYRWSSFPGYVSAPQAKSFLRYEPLLELVRQGRRNRRLAYRSYVERGLGLAAEEWRELQDASRIAIGSDSFIEQMEEVYEDRMKKRPAREDVAFRRLGKKMDPDRVMKVVATVFQVPIEALQQCRHGTWDREVAARCLVQNCGLTQREAAARLGLSSGAAVCIQLRKLSVELQSSRTLRKTLQRIEAELVQGDSNLTFKG